MDFSKLTIKAQEAFSSAQGDAISALGRFMVLIDGRGRPTGRLAARRSMVAEGVDVAVDGAPMIGLEHRSQRVIRVSKGCHARSLYP